MIGTTLSNYTILSKLGEGGMGEVYLAEDTRLDRKVALKVLPPAMANDPERLSRFEREAKAIAALNHPNIVTIYHVEEAADRRLLVMELVEGESLDRVLPPGGLPLARVFDIAIPMADALAAAHDKGIIHRDLKPANVMVTPDGRVKVLDFGLAKLAAEAVAPVGDQAAQAAAPTATLTGQGVVMGTAPYMSPEQLQGRTVDHRSDIFSLGIVLYEMVSGQRPFQGDSGIALASSILKDAPAPVMHLRDELPRHLGRIIHRCLEKEPRERYQSALDVHNELKGLREEVKSGSATVISGAVVAPPAAGPAGEPIPAPPTGAAVAGPAEPTHGARLVTARGSGAARKGLWLGVAAAALLALAAGWWLARGRPEAMSDAGDRPATTSDRVASPARHSIAVLPFANLSPDPENAYFADGLTEELHNALSRIPELRVAGRTSSNAFKDSQEDLRSIGDKLNVATILEGSVRKSGDQVRISAQLVDVADGFDLWTETYERQLDDIFAVQDDIARSVGEALKVTLLGDAEGAAEEASAEAFNLMLQARYLLQKQSEEDTLKALELLEQALAIDPDYAPVWAELGLVYARKGELATSPADAEEFHRQQREALERALELDPNLAIAHSRLAVNLLRAEFDFAAAEAASRKALELAPNNPRVIHNAALVIEVVGSLAEAIGLYRRALEIDPLNLVTYFNLGANYYAAGQLEDAEAALKKVLELSPEAPLVRGVLGNVYLAQRRPKAALAEYSQETFDTARWTGQALASHDLGDREASDQALQEMRDEHGDDAAWAYAQIHAYRGEADAAFRWLERAWEMRDYSLIGLRTNPLLVSLHDDPRWRPLLAEVGLTG